MVAVEIRPPPTRTKIGALACYVRYPFSTVFCNCGYTMCHRFVQFVRLGVLADPCSLCQRFVLPFFDTASTQRKGDFTTTTGGLGETNEIQTAWLQTQNLGSYADLIAYFLSINIPSQPLNLWKMTIKSSGWSNTLFLSATSRKRPLCSQDHKSGGV